MINLADLKPGDVLVSATPDKGGWWIRLRSKLQGRNSTHNHVAVFTHLDSAGRPRGLEGRPGGFGWADLTRYLTHPDTITNAWQPGRTDQDRAALVERLTRMVGVPYDWQAIAYFAAEILDRRVLRLIEQRREWPEGRPPSQFVCSSVIDWAYEDRGWDNPGGLKCTRWTDPAAWTDHIQEHGWHRPPG